MARLRTLLGWIWVAVSLVLLLFTAGCYIFQPDRLAAFTVMPIWVWGGGGFLISCIAFCFLRARYSRVLALAWLVTVIAGSDEARVLTHFTAKKPQLGAPPSYEKQRVIRVLTLNCFFFRYGNPEKQIDAWQPAKDIEAWQPDIVLLQEADPHQVQALAAVLYGGTGDFRSYHRNGVITRWKITRETRFPQYSFQQVTIALPDQRQIEVVNLHLLSAATNLQLWKRSSWQEHRLNRTRRMNELSTILEVLERTRSIKTTPTLVGGDFNAPVWDRSHTLLKHDFTNAFSAVGTGWGNTYQRRLPVLRIDHLYTTFHLKPVRCRAAANRYSDHRLVVADFVMK